MAGSVSRIGPPRRRFLTGAGEAWTPASLAQMTCRLKGQNISGVNNDPIASWPDISGHGLNAVQASGGSQPLLKTGIVNGKSVARFDGSDDYMTIGAPMVDTMHQVLVVISKMSVTQDSATLANGNIAASGMALLARYTSNFHQTVRGGIAIDVSAAASSNNWEVAVLVAAGVTNTAAYDLYIDGGSPALSLGTSPTIPPATSTTVGSYTSGLLRFNGDIAEIIGARSMTLTELNNILAYATSEYGITTTPVAQSATIGNIVYDGDSIISAVFDGVGDSVADKTMALTTNPLHYERSVGETSRTLTSLEADAATRVDGCYSPVRQSVVAIWAGTNDMYEGASGATAYARYATYCASRKAVGWKIVLFTALPRSGYTTPPGFETERQVFNTLVRANYATIGDALCDVAADSRLGDAGDELDTTYYFDLVHLTNVGRAIAAGMLATTLSGMGLT